MADILHDRRKMMKSGFALHPSYMSQSDQAAGADRPSRFTPPPADAPRIDLPRPDPAMLGKSNLATCLADRRSRRRYAETPMSLAELSFILWATAGASDLADPKPAFRTAPSGGARHALDTYVTVLTVPGITPGLYRYLPMEHQLALLEEPESLPEKIAAASCGQQWVGTGSAVVFLVAVPYRSEYRYHADAAKLVLLDAGHACENLYLAAEAVGAGACGIGAYDQVLADKLLSLDGRDAFVVYYSPVGKV